ncbi:MAG: isopentenyl phosphate kinase [Methanothrix sp.]
MKDLYLLKIGGSVITDLSKPNTVASGPVTIGTLLGEAYEAYSSGGFDLIIGHGSGSFGHVAAAQYKVNDGLAYPNSKLGALITHMTAKQLNDIFIEEGIKLEIPLYPFSPANFSLADNGEIGIGFCDHIAGAIEKGFIPVVYGDVMIDRSKGVSIASTEKVLDFIAKKIRPKKVLYGSDTDGVFTANPKEHPDAEHIEIIDSSNIEQALENTGVSKTRVDVTGGMKTKLGKLYETCKYTGAEGYIFNITRPGMLRAMLLGIASPEFYTVVRA